jgi:peptide/nickel transport system permease protein
VVLPQIWWGWSPPTIYTPPSAGIWAHISQFFTPALVLGLGLSASLMRLTRTMMLEVLRQDYVRTAHAKGLGPFPVVMRHALRNAMIPVISLLGLQVAFLLSGTVLIETIFSLPGMGRELVSSLSNRDYPVIQGITVVAGLGVILINLLVDISYGILDPRLKGG